MLHTAMALSLVATLVSPNPSSVTSDSPATTSAPASESLSPPPPPPPSPSLAFGCQRELDCPVPAQCRSGRCVVSEAYIVGLEQGGRARTITGGIVLGGGVVFAVLSAGLIGSGHAHGYDRAAIETGYSISGFAIAALVTGSIVLTIGQMRLHRARMLRASSWTTAQLGSPLAIHF